MFPHPENSKRNKSFLRIIWPHISIHYTMDTGFKKRYHVDNN